MPGEDLCRRCGRCCCQKIRLADGRIFAVSDQFCRFFDPATRLCTVYGWRFKVAPHCLTADQALKIEGLPADCPYVAEANALAAGYRGPKYVTTAELPPEFWRELRGGGKRCASTR